MVAPILGARLETGEVGAGIGFGIELAPDFCAGEHRGQEALLLQRRAMLDNRRAIDADMEWARCAGARQLVGDDGLLQRRRIVTAMLLWPAHTDKSGVVKFSMPGSLFVQR